MSDDLRTRIINAIWDDLIVQRDSDMPFTPSVSRSDSYIDGEVDIESVADAVIRELPELPVKISTQEQLDALPFLTVIREIRPLRKGIDYGGIYERRTSGWQCIAGTWVEPERNGPPMLPVIVLWRGKDEQWCAAM